MTNARFDADFSRIFADHEPLCPAQKEVEGGTRSSAAANRFAAFDTVPATREANTEGDEANV